MVDSDCLVVDDAKPVRTVVRRILERFDLTVVEAANGEDALDICRADMPRLVLLDWNMPGTDGITFLKRLRKMRGGDRPRVVFCTSRSAVTDIQLTFDLGADDFVIKPFDIAILREKLAKFGLIETAAEVA